MISHCVFQGLKHPPIAGSFLDVSFIVKCVCVYVFVCILEHTIELIEHPFHPFFVCHVMHQDQLPVWDPGKEREISALCHPQFLTLILVSLPL